MNLQSTSHNAMNENRAATSKLSENDSKDHAGPTLRSPPIGNFKPDWRFWLIYVSLCLVTFASSVDNTIVFTALPTITRTLGGGSDYVWIANSYVVASIAVQPLFGQVSNILGRRMPSLVVVALFALGSGIAGGANSVAMLIAGRTIQGIGCGGIFVLLDIIVCDLVPLRQRGKYLGPLLATGGLGSTLGPSVGGALTEANWRWVFYITLPFSGLTLVTMALFLHMHHVRDPSWKKNLVRIDLPGNALFIASVTAIVLGLTMGSTTFPWSSWHTIVPVVLGFLGWGLFHVYQASRWCTEPTIPPRLFSNRTSAVGFLLSFLSGVLLEWITYWYPLYFQALLGKSPLISGVDTLPFNVFLMPAAGISGALMTKFGAYRPLHSAAYALLAIGLGLSSMLDSTSSTAEWVIFQIILALGLASTFVTLLPAIQAALPESDVATATATYSGFIWGTTLMFVHSWPVAARISLPRIQQLAKPVRQQVIAIYAGTFRTSCVVALAFALVRFLLVFLEKHIELRQELDTEFSIEGKQKTPDNEDTVLQTASS